MSTEQILQQVEFYFGDSNLPKDKFLKSQMEQNDGWVPISVLLTFNRVKKLTTDIKVVAEALRQSKELLEVNEDGTLVHRKTPLPGEIDTSSRTVYVKGFPTENTLDDIQPIFKDWDVAAIRMRRNKGNFKGSVFVEFKTDEEAKKYLSEERKLGDKSLLVMTKDAYFAKKKQERDERKKAKKEDKETTTEVQETKLEDYPKNRIIHIDNLASTTREKLKELFGKYESIAYVDFSQGNASGYIRFTESNATHVVEEFKKAPFEIDGKTPVVRALEGEEEKTYWENIQTGKNQKSKKIKDHGKKRKGGFGGQGKKAKKQKNEDDNEGGDENEE